ncbi:MAG: prepilin-type N-terminal cleavage/methylation domain-containing protein [Cellvibrionaceae bacterium]|nr:prepilin-type N-terminal cleavage/methylation domain-containing protein [Cellvibrionaceae bacterium]
MKNSGFTLLELVAVIVILGVLSAIALPKFVDLSNSAQASAVKHVSGSLSAAIQLARAKHMAEGGSASSINFNGNNISFIGGLPQPDAGQLRFLLDLDLPATRFTPNWSTAPCSGSSFCVVGNLPFNNGTLPSIAGFSSGTGIFIWPSGYVLSACFAYYLNLNNGDGPVIGSVVSGC